MNYNLIKQIATEKGVSIAKLSREIGLTRNAIYNTLKHESITVKTLEKISKVLDVPITVFFTNEYKSIDTCNNEFEKLKRQVNELSVKVNILWKL